MSDVTKMSSLDRRINVLIADEIKSLLDKQYAKVLEERANWKTEREQLEQTYKALKEHKIQLGFKP